MIKEAKDKNNGATGKSSDVFKDGNLSSVSSGVNVKDGVNKAHLSIIEQQKLAAQVVGSSVVENKPQKVNVNQANVAQNSVYSAKANLDETIVKDQTSDEYAAAVDDLSLADTELSLLNKDANTSIKQAENKNQVDNIARQITDFNTQTAQAKQTVDAYNNYQSSEVLNHTVASDTAQIQKNNVQLHQETVAIFRKDFSEAVKDKVMLMVSQKLQQFDITLDPPEFGNMQVRVNLQGEQAAVNFIVQNQQAKDALEQNMHKLREMLAEQGVDVGGANVEQQNQQNNQDGEQSQQQGATVSRLNDSVEKDSELHVLSADLFNSSATGVDYYA